MSVAIHSQIARELDEGVLVRLPYEAPWLSVDIYDSDFATVRYEPPGPGSGTAYLGNTPRTYFGNESASASTDVLREADGLASWLAQQQEKSSARNFQS